MAVARLVASSLRRVAVSRSAVGATRSFVKWNRLPYPDPANHPEDEIAMTLTKAPVGVVTQKPAAVAAPAVAAIAAPAVGGAPAPAAPAAPAVFTPATYEGFGTPSGSLLYEQAKLLCQNVPKFIEKVEVVRDQLTVFARREHIQPLMLYLCHHSHSQFQQLMEMTCVDWPSRKERFELVYMLLSVQYNARMLVKCSTDELTPVDSLVPIFPNACWYEREVYDMFGVFFAGNPDLRRILTDYGFQGHPLRKDFPISGYQEVRYDDTLKRVVYEPLELTQEFRNFDTTIPWRTMHQKVGNTVQFDPARLPAGAAPAAKP